MSLFLKYGFTFSPMIYKYFSFVLFFSFCRFMFLKFLVSFYLSGSRSGGRNKERFKKASVFYLINYFPFRIYLGSERVMESVILVFTEINSDGQALWGD